MGEFKINQISLFTVKLSILLRERKAEGFRFVERLLNDYIEGTNRGFIWCL